MKFIKLICICFAGLILFQGCEQSTPMKSDPGSKTLDGIISGNANKDTSIEKTDGQSDDDVQTQNGSDSYADQNQSENGEPDQTEDEGDSVSQNQAKSLDSSLRLIAMGDFDIKSLASFPECTLDRNIQRAACSVQNSLCRSRFVTSCYSGDCRRLFKCVSGQTSSLVLFPMGDGFTLSGTGLQLCSRNSHISGSECSTVNSRCLSSFCTKDSGPDCGRRLFKCLPTGAEGKLFYRWMGDKLLGELSGIPQCVPTKNIAGSRCSTENSNCVSEFFTDVEKTRRRLFKCTP